MCKLASNVLPAAHSSLYLTFTIAELPAPLGSSVLSLCSGDGKPDTAPVTHRGPVQGIPHSSFSPPGQGRLQRLHQKQPSAFLLYSPCFKRLTLWEAVEHSVHHSIRCEQSRDNHKRNQYAHNTAVQKT